MLGPRVSLYPQRHNFAVGIPTFWYLNKFVLPKGNPQHESVETRLRWGGLLALGPVSGMYNSCCSCQFHLRWGANANAVFSGIWALDVHMILAHVPISWSCYVRKDITLFQIPYTSFLPLVIAVLCGVIHFPRRFPAI